MRSTGGMMGHRLAAWYALLTAAGLLGTWAATWADILPAEFAPRQLEPSHIAAEVATALVLVAGAALSLRAGRAHWMLAAGLGALSYATLNVIGDFTDAPTVLVVLSLTLTFTLAALVAAFRQTRPNEREGDAR